MRVLVTWGSKRGGTEGIARIVGATLAERGHDVVMKSAEHVRDLDGIEAAFVGGALYGNRWPSNVRRFVRRNVQRLREMPVWLFSSGPLDDSAEREEIPPPNMVAVLAERVGARGHMTFGGKLDPDAKDFPARSFAAESAGDFRNPAHIRRWASARADELPTAQPGKAINYPAHALTRSLLHGATGWALCAGTMTVLTQLLSPGTAIVLHAIAAPLFFLGIAVHYFGARGARDPLPTAILWTLMVLALDVVIVASAVSGSFAMLASVAGLWLPLALIFLVTAATGGLMSTLPWPKTSSERPSATAR